ncbi:MAG TPA: benzoate-CoA ligase family protein [Pseudomonadales bacterium]|nr:benzoate-CoA ligase family protein [Pseudomonadales bacterium]
MNDAPSVGNYNAADALLLPNLAHERAARVAVVDDAGTYTYAEIDRRASRFANVLRARGLVNRQRVLLCLEDSVDFPVCFLGAIRAGAIPVPLNTLLTPKDYAYIVSDSEAKLLVVSAALAPAWQSILEPTSPLDVLVSGRSTSHPTLDRALADASHAHAVGPTRRDEPAFWLYTSGTTGNPKGVIHRHGDLEFTARTYGRQVLGITADDVVFSAAKLFFAYGLGNALTFPFSVGATVVLTAARPTPSVVKAILATHRPTLFCGVPTLYAMLLAEPELPPRDRLRMCISAGEALPETLLQRWRDGVGLDILDGIGTTEMLHIFVSNRPGDVAPGTTGRAVPGYAVRIVDEHGNDTDVDAIGDLEVRGDSAAVGYWKLPEQSGATFRDGWVRTGDKYLRRASGHLVYCGRRDDLLKVGGIYVSPMEVENALLAHPAVIEVAVVGAQDADKLIKPKAIVVARSPSPALADELIAHVRGRLADYKRPRWIEFVDSLPKTATGKVQRYKLR